MGCVKPANALGIVEFGWAYTFSDKVLFNSKSYPAPDYGFWGWALDPPADVLQGQATFRYDPSVMTILPQYSGFLGPFSSDPSVTIAEGSDPNVPFDVAQLSGSRPGMTWSLTVNPDTVVLNFDTSANPVSVPDGNPFNFFLLATATSSQVTGWTQQTSGEGQFRELASPTDHSQTYMICSSPDRSSYYCGDPAAENYATHGYTAVMAPEPSYLPLLAVGLLGLCGHRLRRRGHRVPAQLG
jgi:hypothetical protein